MTTQPEDRLSVSTQGTPSAPVLVVAGEVDPLTASLLSDAIDGVTEAEDRVVLDVGGVTFIDSAGLRVLADAQRAFEARDVTLVLRRPTRALRTLLDVTGMADYVETTEVIEES